MTHGGSTQAWRRMQFLGPRRRMVKRLEQSGVADPRVLAARRVVPRHPPVPEGLREEVYRFLDRVGDHGWQ